MLTVTETEITVNTLFVTRPLHTGRNEISLAGDVLMEDDFVVGFHGPLRIRNLDWGMAARQVGDKFQIRVNVSFETCKITGVRVPVPWESMTLWQRT
jgi:hypothetical protein